MILCAFTVMGQSVGKVWFDLMRKFLMRKFLMRKLSMR
jgi:hypothetical protein